MKLTKLAWAYWQKLWENIRIYLENPREHAAELVVILGVLIVLFLFFIAVLRLIFAVGRRVWQKVTKKET